VTHTSSLEVLPDDVLGNILERLELPELVGLSCVSKRLKNRVSLVLLTVDDSSLEADCVK